MNWPRLSAGPGRIVVAVAAFLLPLQPLALGADDPGALHGEYVVDVVELDNGDAIVAHSRSPLGPHSRVQVVASIPGVPQ